MKIGNCVFFYKKLKRVIKNVEIIESEFVLLYLDLDCFKVINDIFGYLLGDYILEEVVKCF